MVEAGVDVFRLNFSHGTHDVHTATLEAIRQLAAETETQLAVLQDLCGPKIRLGRDPRRGRRVRPRRGVRPRRPSRRRRATRIT